MILNADGVAKERTLAGRLFQMVGAAVRKPRVPTGKLHRVTDNRLAEADRKVLREVYRWSRLARYGGLPVLRALKVRVAILNLTRESMGRLLQCQC